MSRVTTTILFATFLLPANNILADSVPAVVEVETVEQTTAELMMAEANRLRKLRGLPPQKLDGECTAIAQRWAEKMAQNNWMRHGGGEQIIARDYKSVDSVFRGWMNSPGHRRWVLTRKPRAGWGRAKSKSGRLFWAGAFRSERRIRVRTSDHEINPVLRRANRIVGAWLGQTARKMEHGIDHLSRNISGGLRGFRKRLGRPAKPPTTEIQQDLYEEETEIQQDLYEEEETIF